MIKYLAENTDYITDIEHLNVFENLSKVQDCKFTASPAYPLYTSLGSKPAMKVAKVGTTGNKSTFKGGMKLDEEGNPLMCPARSHNS